MMQSIPRILYCLIAIMVMAGCASQKIQVESAHKQAACKINCQKQLQACSQVCHNNCRECSHSANCIAAIHYNKYKHEQIVQGEFIGRELNSYRDPLQCRKITCNCLADYNVCTQSCTGTIHKRLQVAPVCC